MCTTEALNLWRSWPQTFLQVPEDEEIEYITPPDDDAELLLAWPSEEREWRYEVLIFQYTKPFLSNPPTHWKYIEAPDD